MIINEDDDNEDDAVRNLAIGISAGSTDFKNYDKWFKFNLKVLENKKNVMA